MVRGAAAAFCPSTSADRRLLAAELGVGQLLVDPVQPRPDLGLDVEQRPFELFVVQRAGAAQLVRARAGKPPLDGPYGLQELAAQLAMLVRKLRVRVALDGIGRLVNV